MRKSVFSVALMVVLLLIATNSQAQSWKDLFNSDNISKVVDAVTGKSAAVDMTGTWTYSGSAVEFKSDNLLKKAGGAVAATAAESKMNEELAKLGIKEGQMSFTFNADSTFVSTIGKRNMQGTYSYNAQDKTVALKYLKLLKLNTKINYSAQNMELLFESDTLLKIIVFLSSKSNSTAIKAVGQLAEGYDGMLLGFNLKKQ